MTRNEREYRMMRVKASRVRAAIVKAAAGARPLQIGSIDTKRAKLAELKAKLARYRSSFETRA